ncbi:hypothetical protein FQR65_LT18019 [Abscondita terminalis]|nr:hypothetical protein FQR65_LT18019 [Abscondita terminalis]
MKETKERFFLFIGKLEDKLREFAEASIPELEELNRNDTDEYKREYSSMKNAVLGTIESIMKKAREEACQKPQQLYLQIHELRLSLMHETDRNTITQKEKQIQDLEQQKEKLDNRLPDYTKTICVSMFDEWNKINPDMKEQHEKFYARLLDEYKPD